MESSLHVIQSTRLNIKCHERDEALVYQQRFSELFKEHLQSKLELVFNEYSGSNTLVLDRLEIDLGNVNLENEEEIMDKFSRQVDLAISAEIAAKRAVFIDHKDSLLENFGHFVQSGYLPWQNTSASFDDITLTLSEMKEWDEHIIHSILKFLSSNNTRRRIVYQSNDKFLSRILTDVLGGKGSLPSKDRLLIEITQLVDELIDHKESSIRDELKKLKEISFSLDNDAELEDEEATLVSIENAGIVMMNPAFMHLMEHTGLTKSNQFITEEARIKAIFLMHFIATGEEKLEEESAVLYKLLCNMALATSIPTSIKLTDLEKATCTEALNAIISEWKGIKNTGIDAFRENFLQRNGSIKKTEEGVELYIEHSSIDIILTLTPPPWTVGFIKLPWMESTLTVNWF